MPPPCGPKLSGLKTLTDALELCFEQFADSVAIDAPGCKITYSELDDITCRLASELRTHRTDQQLQSEPIAISMSRSIEFYVAQISVLRAGGFFLPIDPAQPAERIKFLLADSLSSLLLVRESDSFTNEDSAVVSISVDANRWAEQRHDSADQTSVATTDNLGKVAESDFAYMIYTSGSRGRPKGVPIAHRAICNLCHWWADEFKIAPGERTLQMMSVGFDASMEEIYPALVTGGTLVPLHAEALNSMAAFLHFLKQQNIQTIHVPSAFWHALSASFATHESLTLPACVQTVVLGGEKADQTLVESWFSRIGTKVRLINAYGPTEATVVASYAVLNPKVKPSIGTPIRGVSFCICDTDGQQVAAGQTGELYIGGIGVANGYWNREELTAEKFVDSPLKDGQPHYRTGDLVQLNKDGNYEFMGRIDDQIKLRGYRIEPGEISACLGTHPQVSQTHVVAQKLNTAQHLIGYVIANPDDSPSESELREFIGQQLPSYMVPTRIVVMESFPTTTGGKLDLERFPIPAANSVSGTDHHDDSQLLTPTEQKIGKVWEKVLGGSQLGPAANFFQIGGDSLSAMRLVLLLESEFPGPLIPVAALIPNPTIAAMADYMDRRKNSSPTTASKNWPLLTRAGDCQQPISVVCMHAAGGGGVFYRQLFEGSHQATPIAILESAILYQENPITCEHQSVAEMAQDYVDCLIDAGCEQQLTLVGYSFGCLLAFEMAHLLETQGFVVKQIINIDSPNPQTMKRRNRFSKFRHRVFSTGTISERIADFKLIRLRKRRIRALEKCKKAQLPPPVELRPLALELVFVALAEKYAPGKSNYKMYLIKGENSEAECHVPDDYGWTAQVSDLTTVQIPGGHNTIFSEPYLQSLITAFHHALAE